MKQNIFLLNLTKRCCRNKQLHFDNAAFDLPYLQQQMTVTSRQHQQNLHNYDLLTVYIDSFSALLPLAGQITLRLLV